MPFTVIFLPTDASPPAAQVEQLMKSTIAADIGRPVGANGLVKPPGRPAFTFLDNAIALRNLSPLVCRVIFDAARRTNSYIFTTGPGRAPLMMTGSSGQPPSDLGRPAVVAGPSELCSRLQTDLVEWDRDIRRMQAGGVIGADEQPIEPSPSPGDAKRLDHDPTGVAEECEKIVHRETTELGWQVSRVLVTQEPRWGVVWRADVTTPDEPPVITREVCWQHRPAQLGLSLSSHPLTMFDPKKNLEPLPAK